MQLRRKGRRSQRWLLPLLALIVVILGAPFVSMAQEGSAQEGGAQQGGAQGQSSDPLAGVNAVPFASEAALVDSSSLASITMEVPQNVYTYPDGRVQIIVELTQPAAYHAFLNAGGKEAAGALSAGQSELAVVRAAQSSFLSRLSGAGISVQPITSTGFLANTVTVAINPAQIDALRAQPGVARLYYDVMVERDMYRSVPFLEVPTVWNTLYPGGSSLGLGTVVAVIDSGIDFSHTNFGGSGVWPTNPAVRTAAPLDANFGPGEKVWGGWDYVGDLYNGGNTSESPGIASVMIPTPDPNPIDCSRDRTVLSPPYPVIPGGTPVGHGSHVAGTVAGFGVNADGSTYAGGYNSVPFGALKVGPGVAPYASLLALRVFGCFGSTSSANVAAAIDDAASGRFGVQADVVNMSLGSNFGYGRDDGIRFIYNAVIPAATSVGTLIVASAGNSSDTHYITGSPGAVASALSVASIAHDVEWNGISLTGTTANGTYAVRNAISNAPSVVAGPYPIYYLGAEDGCQAADYNTFPAGHVAMVNFTGLCGSGGLYGAAAGATPNRPLGLLIVSNTASFQNLGCAGAAPSIPCVSLLKITRDFIQANQPAVRVTFNPALTAAVPELIDVVSTFSSRGPASFSAGIKPDVAAPGDRILSVSSGSGSAGYSIGGTSMAAPHVAGLAAILLSNPRYSSWAPTQIKALIMNTANNDVFSPTNLGFVLPNNRAGSGRIDVLDAFENEVIAYNFLRPDVVGVNFGNLWVVPGETAFVERTVRIQNRSASAVTYDITIDTNADNNISSFATNEDTITVPAFSSADVQVFFDVDIPVSGVAPWNLADPTLSPVHFLSATFSLPRHYLSAEVGNLILTPTAGSDVSLRVPLYGHARAASTSFAENDPVLLSGAATGAGIVDLAGTGVDTGVGAGDITSAVTAFRLMGTDNLNDTDPDMGIAPEYDLEHIGVSSNFNNVGGNTAGSANANSRIWFAITTRGDWSTTSMMTFRVWIDPGANGFTFNSADYFAQTQTPNDTIQGSPSDIPYVLSFRMDQGGGPLIGPVNSFSPGLNTYLYENNVLFIGINPGQLFDYDFATPGNQFSPMFGAGVTKFRFFVTAQFGGFIVDASPEFEFDMAEPFIDTHYPTLSLTTPPTWNDLPNNNVPFTYDLRDYPLADIPAPALLLLHHHNVAGANGFNRAEVVSLDVDEANVGITDFYTDPDPAVAGAPLDLHVKAFNFTNGVSVNSTLTVTLPNSLSYTGYTLDEDYPGTIGTPSICVHTGEPFGGTLNCMFAQQPLENAHLTINTTVDGGFAGDIASTATLTSDVIELDGSDNIATLSVDVPPGQPVTISPMGASANTDPSFVWERVPGAGWYLVWVSGLSSEFVESQWVEAVAVCDVTTCTYDPNFSLLSGTYSWWVLPWNEASLEGPWSNETVFSVTVAPGIVTPISPTGGIVDTSPDFTWELLPGVSWYHLWVSDVTLPTGLLVHELWYPATGICNFTTDVCTVDGSFLALSGGAYKWWVRTFNAEGGYGAWNTPTDFTENIAPAVPVPMIPTGTSANTNPPFEWSRVPGATHYFVWLSGPGGFITQQQFETGAVCDATSCEADLGVSLSGGWHAWFVRSWNTQGGLSAWSAETNFTVTIAPSGTTGISPTGAVASASPTFTWNHEETTTHYLLWIAQSGGGTVHMEWFTEGAAVCTDDDICTATPAIVLPNGNYRFYVRTSNAYGMGPWSPQVDFTVNAAPYTPEEIGPATNGSFEGSSTEANMGGGTSFSEGE
ncbi:MAG: S8 family serine peptidase [Chloroflexota bacterium]|nr:S8 family serine peptidase [Chloroflexota bacterium]